MMMLTVLRRPTLQFHIHSHRTLVTSAQKRALDKTQLEATSAVDTTSATSTAANNSNASSATGTSGGNGMLIAGSAVAVIGGLLYAKPEWKDMVMNQLQVVSPKKQEEPKKREEDEEAVIKVEEKQISVKDFKKEEKEEDSSLLQKEKNVSNGVTIEAMALLGIPANPVRFGVKEPVASFEIVEGNRVTVQSMNVDKDVDEISSEESVRKVDEKQELVTDSPKAVVTYKPNAMDAAAELFTNDIEKSALELAQLRAQTLRLDISKSEELKGIDTMSPEELRLKIVSLVAALSDSARHEAVRLKEYATIAEKQTADKYIEILQKQRVEFERELANQLRNTEDDLKRVFLEKERNMREQYESIAQAQLDAQNEDFIEKWNKQSEELTKSLNERLEVALADGIAKNKAEMVSKLEAKVSEMDDLMKQLDSLRQKASMSANFERGSQAAHRLSAAALALANKFETSESAFSEVAALKAIVDENDDPISSALSRIPAAASSGVPTLPELQSMFIKVKDACRQAAMVPKGSGLGGQLFGYAFSALTIEPPVGLIDGNSDDQILARAHYFVQNGDLESAVAQLDQLQGQASFVASDWQSAALSRAIVDQAVRVIKMECALINKNMGGSSE